MKLRRALAGLPALGLLASGLTFAAPASAATLSCGDIVTEDTTLSADVGPCPGPFGLAIGADNVTLDLGRFTVSGSAAEGDGAGILLDSVTGSTVRRGTVEGFDAGVVIRRGGGNTVERVLAQDNVQLGDGEYGDGILILSSIDNRVQNNTVLRNGRYSGISIVSETDENTRISGPKPTGNVIAGNTIRDNNLVFADMQVRIEGPGAEYNTVARNMVFGNDEFTVGGNHGIFIAASFNGFDPEAPILPLNPANAYNDIVGNTVRENFNGSGIYVRARPLPITNPHHNTIRRNFVTENGRHGIGIEGDPAIEDRPAFGAFNNRVLENRSVGNNVGGYEVAFDLTDFNPDCDENRWFANIYGTAQKPCVTLGGTQVEGVGEAIANVPESARDRLGYSDSVNGSGRLELAPPG